MKDDWGAGMSTFVFGSYCKEFGGHITTIDISLQNMSVCREVTKDFTNEITYIVDDSLHFLRNFNQMIDLLYLDSMDCPLIDDPNDLTVLQSQNHQLSEIQLALPKLKETSLVLLDDCQFVNGGKGKLTRLFLKSEGWTELMDGQQSLWSKI
jgi:hypothetical protein